MTAKTDLRRRAITAVDKKQRDRWQLAEAAAGRDPVELIVRQAYSLSGARCID
jgi:hypothetical protein